MKKLTLLLILLVLLCSCSQTDIPLPGVQTPQVTTDETTLQAPPHEHLFQNEVVTREARCTEVGFKNATCACGATEETLIPATGHTFGEAVVTKQPTCIETGEKTIACSACGATEKTPISATGKHIFGEAVVTKQPTCVVDGEKIVTCTTCDETEKTSLAAKGHAFGEAVIAKQPTCIETGEETVTCSTCGEIEKTSVPATGEHVYGKAVVTTEPTCVKDGEKTATCTTCDAIENTVIPAKGHTFGEAVVTVEPTCVAEGEKVATCACGATEKTTISATGKHVYSEAVVTTEPTCVKDGEKVATCACGAVEKTLVPATGKHTYGEAVVTTEATCVKEGEKTATCITCDAIERTTITETERHNYVDNVCTWCQKTELVLVSSSSDYDADGDGQKDVYYFSSQPAQRCTDGVWLWAGHYDKGMSGAFSKATISDIQHWYIEPGSDQRLVYRVTVPDAGVYEMILHLRLKDIEERGAKFTFNAGTDIEQVFETSHVFDATSLNQAQSDTVGTYMYGIRVYLQGGENILSITAASQSPKSQHFREFYFVKIEEQHSHNFENSEITKQPTCNMTGQRTLTCLCGESQTVAIPMTSEHAFQNGVCSACGETDISLTAVSSAYDADGDGKNDVYYFSPQFSDRFADAVHVWAGDYDRSLSSSAIGKATFSQITHWYVDNAEQYIVYRVNVPQAGVYEMAIHMRMKDAKQRGTKYTINEGSKYEQVFQTSHEFQGDGYLDVRNEATVGTYMYGIKVNLLAGENIIKIERASDSSNPQHYRDLYFLRVGDWHKHVHFLRTVVSEPTCALDGEAVFTCICGESRTVVIPATSKHTYVDGICAVCTHNEENVGIIEYAFLFDKAGFAGGTVSLLPEFTGIYTLYWGNESGKLPSYTMLGSFIAYAGKVTDYSIYESTAIPAGVTCLLAVNTTGGRYTYSFIIPEERRLTAEELYIFGAISDTHQGTRYGPENQSVERLINAGRILSQKGAILVGINGDIANDNTEREYILHAEALKGIYEFALGMPVWCVSGNHEAKYTGFLREWYLKYTRNVVDYDTDLIPVFTEDNDLDFVVELPDGSVIIFLHQVYYDYGASTSRLMDDYQLDWLGDRLEQYKDRTVFLFFHSQMQGKVGDLNGSDALIMRTDTEDYKRLDAYFKQYTNVVFFNGHSHGSFDAIFSETFGDRIFNTYGGEYATLVHLPSLADSQLGHIVHVYEDCIVFEGYHFGNEKTIAYATYIIEK